MLTLLRMTTGVVAALIAAIAFDWTDPAPRKLVMLVGGPLAALILALLWLTRTRPSQATRLDPNPWREVWVGLLAAGGWTGLLLLFFVLAARIPELTEPILDANRDQVESVLQLLVRGGNWRAAADEAERALEDPHTPAWTRDLAERAVKYLANAAADDPPDAADLLSRAIAIAQRYGVAADYPRTLQQQLPQRRAIKQLHQRVAEAQNNLSAATAESRDLAKQLSDQQAQAAKNLESAEAASAAKLADALNQAHLRGDAHLQDIKTAWGRDRLKRRTELVEFALRAEPPLAELRQLLATDIAAAERWKIDTAAAREALQMIDSAIASRLPRPLPTGCTAHVLRVHTTPAHRLRLLDVQVLGADGQPYVDLVRRDFVASQRERRLTLTSEPFSQVGQLRVALALDCSGSMQGEPLRQLMLAVIAMLERLSAGAHVRLTTFNNRVLLLADWTRDPASAIPACRRIHAEGSTALFAAIDEGIRSLSQIPERSELVQVIFSDGANSVTGPSKDSLIAAAKQRGVRIYFVALNHGRQPAADIEAIASATGGHTLHAAHAGELADRFRALVDQLNERGYRLAIIDGDPAQQITLTIGGANSIHLTVNALDAAKPVAQRNTN